MAKVIAIGQPINDAERLVIAHLRDRLPDTYTLIHNFEITRHSQDFEVDIALLAPHAIYLIDVKGTRGTIDVYGSKWYPEGRQPFASPLGKLKGHARALKGLITDSHPARPELDQLYIDAVVILPAPDAHLNDPSGKDTKATTTLARAERFLKDSTRLPHWANRDIRGFHRLVLNALQANSRPSPGPKQFGSWAILEELGGPNDDYTDYRVYNAAAGPKSGTALLRAYRADPYLTDPDAKAQQNARIQNAYLALNNLPSHPNLLGVRDFFASEMEDTFYLVTDDIPGNVLKLYFKKPDLALTYDQKTKIAQDLLSALHHAHCHQITHRNLNPSAILVGTNSQTYLIDFDYARSGTQRSHTIADDITDLLDKDYLAPECQGGNTGAASPAADIFAAGLLLYELFTGHKPFADPSDSYDRRAIFPILPTAHTPGLPAEFDTWLQQLCTFEIQSRPTAKQAWTRLRAILRRAKAQPAPRPNPEPAPRPSPDANSTLDYRHLAPDTQISRKYRIEKKLGEGSFGVVYKALDTLADRYVAMKIILRDRYSVIERLKKEFQVLSGLPDHPHVVKVFYPDYLPNHGPPFIAFAYVDGIDVKEMVRDRLFSAEDGLRLGLDVASGLAHLHQHNVCHCDIKPSNLLWTDGGAMILDFNVSVRADQANRQGGGSPRYLPPDIDLDRDPQTADLVDRDLYALGVTLYEVITGHYPWETAHPPAGQPAKDPRDYSGLGDLAPDLAAVMLKLIAPKRCDRYQNATEVLSDLKAIPHALRLPPPPEPDVTLSRLGHDGEGGNPFVSHLVTLYSQSHRSNAGTRGLDTFSDQTYIPTLLDDELLPAVLQGEFQLVIITGNAGDGKTAFLQKLELYAAEQGGTLDHSPGNGCRMVFHGRTYLSNYDGSQDEGDQTNDTVLDAFFAPFQGHDAAQWQTPDVRLIAINEGRLIDFLTSRGDTFSQLQAVVWRGLQTGQSEAGVAILNLNLRSVVAAVPDRGGSILERQIRKFTHPKFWEPCQTCEIADRCYALHNARTFQDPTAGEKVIERLQTLYTLTHLRNRLHITLRDLRSALSYLLVSDRTCAEIKQLYQCYAPGTREVILDSYYFNSWRGGTEPTGDRLLTLLKVVDMGLATDARLDRELDFMAPTAGGGRFGFEQRANYDQQIFAAAFEDLPRDFGGWGGRDRFVMHQSYVAALRRRYYFEQQRSEGWQRLLPYRSAPALLDLLQGQPLSESALPRVLAAINRGEGLTNPDRLQGDIALQVREVENGTIRSYRIFPKDRFTLDTHDQAQATRFVEHMPSGLVLRYHSTHSTDAELIIDLDMFEMLERLNDGYRPSVEQTQGYYLSLVVFKNLLASAPYREVLLTTTGHDFYRVRREDAGQLVFQALDQEVAHGAV